MSKIDLVQHTKESLRVAVIAFNHIFLPPRCGSLERTKINFTVLSNSSVATTEINNCPAADSYSLCLGSCSVIRRPKSNIVLLDCLTE